MTSPPELPLAARTPGLLRGDAWRLVAAVLVSGSAVLLFAVHVRPAGYVPLVVGVLLGFAADRILGRDLMIVAIGMGIVSSIPLHADLSNAGIRRFAVALSLAVIVPYVVSRYGFGDRTIHFPIGTGRRWGRMQLGYLAAVLVAGYLLLPAYFIGSGAYLNWPAIATPEEIGRLFLGVNAVGIWDELFFVCVIFALFRKHFPLWEANLLQAAVFVSFLWELGYQSWGPVLTVPFALVQGVIFSKTRSLTYVVCVHLLFDLVVFAVLVHAHNPELLDIFITSPAGR